MNVAGQNLQVTDVGVVNVLGPSDVDEVVKEFGEVVLPTEVPGMGMSPTRLAKTTH